MRSKTLKTFLAGTLVLTFAVLFSSQTMNAQVDTSTEGQGDSVVDVLDANEKTGDFAQLLEESGFASVLQQQGPYTIVAPSNDAIEASGNSVEDLKESPEKVKQLVQGHLYQGNVPSDQVESEMGVSVEDTDESASNGTVHVVDKVIESQPQPQQ